MPDALARQTRTLYDEAELEAVLDAMAREVASRLAGQPRPVVVGILRRARIDDGPGAAAGEGQVTAALRLPERQQVRRGC